MKRFCVLFTSTLFLAGFAVGQDSSRVDVYGGYSFLNIDTNDISSRQNANGWEASVAGNFNRYFAIEGEVSGYYKNYSLDLSGLGGGLGNVEVKVTDYSYAGGPRINFRPFFVHALFGGDHLKASALGFSASQDGMSGLAGGGVQWKLDRHFSLRASADYVFTRHNIFASNSVTQNNFRVGAGIVVSFGGKSSNQVAVNPEPRERVQDHPSQTHVPEQKRSARNVGDGGMTITVLGIDTTVAEGGAKVTTVSRNSPGFYAGLKEGDIINAINGRQVHTPMELAAGLSETKPGDRVRLSYLVQGAWQTQTEIVLPAEH